MNSSLNSYVLSFNLIFNLDRLELMASVTHVHNKVLIFSIAI